MNIFAGLGWKVASWWPGVILAICGSTLNNMGTNVMKLAINRRQLMPPSERPRTSSMPVWMAGFGMFVLGTAMSFGAFKFAAQSLLSGLGSVQFLSQVFFSRFILHERIERYAYFGVGLIISGCTMLVIFGAHDTKNYRPEELAALYGRSEYVCYMLGAGAMACTVSLLYSSIRQKIARKRGLTQFDITAASVRERQMLAGLFSINSALFGSQAVVLAKALSMLLIQALHPNPLYSNPFLSYQTYFIMLGFSAAATFWVTRLTAGLRLFDAVYLVPMMQICWILFSTLAGGIYYEEFIGFGRKEYGAYVVGFLFVLGGVALLCPRDDAKSLNAADVIYDIVTDENPDFTKKMQDSNDQLARAEEGKNISNGGGEKIRAEKKRLSLDRTGKYQLVAGSEEDGDNHSNSNSHGDGNGSDEYVMFDSERRSVSSPALTPRESVLRNTASEPATSALMKRTSSQVESADVGASIDGFELENEGETLNMSVGR